MLIPPLLTDAVSEVAAGHETGCTCTVCLAATGDPEAMQAVLVVALGRDLYDEMNDRAMWSGALREPCFICGDPRDHAGLPHGRVTGDGLTRADVEGSAWAGQ